MKGKTKCGARQHVNVFTKIKTGINFNFLKQCNPSTRQHVNIFDKKNEWLKSLKVKTKCGARQHVNKKYKELKLCSIFLRHPRCPVGLRGFRGQKALEATKATEAMEVSLYTNSTSVTQ